MPGRDSYKLGEVHADLLGRELENAHDAMADVDGMCALLRHLGADAVGMGRMQGYGLPAAGSAGDVRMLEILEDECSKALGLMGVNSFADLDRSCLAPAPVVTDPHALSAFPLLDVDANPY